MPTTDPIKEKNMYWKTMNCWFDDKRDLQFGPNNKPVLP